MMTAHTNTVVMGFLEVANSEKKNGYCFNNYYFHDCCFTSVLQLQQKFYFHYYTTLLNNDLLETRKCVMKTILLSS